MRAGTAIAVIGLAVPLFAGCGSSSKSDSASGSGGTATTSTTAAASGAAPKAVKATIKDFDFHPGSITVAKGGKITWTDKDTANHTVTFKTAGAPKGVNNLRQGQHGTVTFPKAGTYKYVCTYHPNMHGTVVVR